MQPRFNRCMADPGSDFNPASTTWQSNSFAAYPTNNNGEISAWDYYNSGLKTNQFYNNVITKTN